MTSSAKRGALAIASMLAALIFGHPAEAAPAPKCGLNSGKPATGSPIPIGGIVGRTGPADFSSSGDAAAAYFKCVNENGGINGRPIEYTLEDDAWKPEQAAQAAAKLVIDKKVVALVGSNSFVECAANEATYEKNDVLVVGAVGIPRDCFFGKNYSSTNAGPRLSNLGAVQYMHQKFGVKNIVCIAPNIPGVGEFSCDGVKAWGATKGAVVSVILIDPAAIDMTSIVLQAMSFKPDLIEASLPRDGVIALLKAAEDQDLGSKVKFAAPTSVYNLEFPKTIGPYWDNKVYAQLELEPFDKASPDMLNWYAVLDKYARKDIQRDTFNQAGYLSARWIVEIMMQMDPTKIDRSSVTAALRGMKSGYLSDIACGPWYFGPGNRHNPNHAGSVAVVSGEKWVTQQSCFEVEDPDLVDVLATEKEIGIRK
ncbi:ABC transporter substrate-binding protein [Bradyrhizobium sp. CCGUVB1N3]|uniref:ABC transporter substrate-binding protein n=1 Tax=Bradyrhizobium sp. CCGUVB1N3 TaxID=2949629 RepID=UPI0020B1D598|nr:ABC transporter substrate-binding protein [Bradyrhizobium sp. CCGUVB1N3]MCP3473122.1 ABC transporter substrate-binding protein [Bradyrhizobium sp. CCGUVB1N3]